MKNKIRFEQIACSLLIFLYTYTAISKFSAYARFRSSLRRSPLIDQGADTIAWLLPAAELIVVLLLFFDASRKAGLYASLFLLTGFTLYIGAMLLFVTDLPCSCGGVIGQMSWKQHLLFNVFFMGVSITGILLEKNITFLRRQAKPKT